MLHWFTQWSSYLNHLLCSLLPLLISEIVAHGVATNTSRIHLWSRNMQREHKHTVFLVILRNKRNKCATWCSN
uniref:Secreted protein n=1 Tax=Arundo donax TaxID=35708 RepID=A0A0A8ZEX1_ARUDO